MKKFFSVICVLCLVGCGGSWISIRPDYTVDKEKNTTSQIYYEKNYTIGEKMTAFVGEEIIKVRSFEKETLYSSSIKKSVRSSGELTIDAKYRFINYHIKSEKNKEYKVLGTIAGKTNNLVKMIDDSGNMWGIIIDDNGMVHNTAIYSFYHNMLFYPSTISVSPTVFEMTRKKEAEEGKTENAIPGMAVELIYSGKNDVSLNATYREFTPDNFARPAFFQNITYRADAKQIRFQNFVIKIHEVSNESISYTVIEDGIK